MSSAEAPVAATTPASRPREPSRHSKWHNELRRRVAEKHPEVRRLYGAEPLQLLGVFGLLAARWGLAYALRDAPVLLIGLLSCTVGCWLVHAAGTYVHEQGHRLIVSREPYATAVDALIEAGLTSFGSSVSYQYKHVNFHHVYLGDYEWDSEMRDLCAHVSIITAEQRASAAMWLCVVLEGCLSVLLPVTGLVAQDIVEALRGALLIPDVSAGDTVRRARFALPPALRTKQRAFALLSASCYLLVWWLWGPRACLFGLWSLAVKASRFDVVGWGQDMAEHNSDDDNKPTNTTHTVWNWIFCNTGYHAEHHSFPSVPGCYLPRLSLIAPEEFGSCVSHTAWHTLWLRWVGSGFKSFRFTAQQRELASSGRCARSHAREKKAG